jgi:alkylhydroperoxidase family enzyme
MAGRYEGFTARVAEAVRGTRGDTDPALRRAVEARAAALGGRAADGGSAGAGVNGAGVSSAGVGGEGETEEVPVPLRVYVDKVARHAYEVTDEDVAALRRAGYTEDAIFEVTVSAAVGAGLARLERGLAALGRGRAER